MASTSTTRDTSIRTYRAKRDFTITGEPAPAPRRGKRPAPIFVVQKHEAHRAGLHWDFRLEHDGVLWSWAVRKGPSLDPADKRIAVHVEDHPLDYADFEGAIPDGQYGAGAVEQWDRGTWQPLDDPDEGMRKGELRFVLDGKRLHGRFTLVRLKPRPGQRSRQDNWLLIKGHDEAERKGADAPTIEQQASMPRQARKQRKNSPAEGAVRAGLPQRQAPQLAAVIDKPPEGKGWVSEIKFDGYRLLCWLDHGKVRLLTRNGLDWTDRLPAVARAVANLSAETALVDGELVALEKTARRAFRRCRRRCRPAGTPRCISSCSISSTWTAGTCGNARCSSASACCPASATGAACCVTATTRWATLPACCAGQPGWGWKASSASRPTQGIAPGGGMAG